MKRTTSSLLGLGLTVSMALHAGCTAAPTNGVGLTAIGPGPGSASRSDTFRLGAGDALGAIIFAGGDAGGMGGMDRPSRFEEGSGYATVNEGERRPR